MCPAAYKHPYKCPLSTPPSTLNCYPVSKSGSSFLSSDDFKGFLTLFLVTLRKTPPARKSNREILFLRIAQKASDKRLLCHYTMSTTKNTSFLGQFFSGVKTQAAQDASTHPSREDLPLQSSMDKIDTGSSQTLHQHGLDWGHREHLLRLAFVFDTNNY
ncbi:hypothetical protein Y032_0374g212 [Ancylostoma ceylanicum]|uniref:Uncharacterized protein n=1 Tax=Ancylostoma ceylanicum TaxID=53326 RepID=A0A016RUW6_9BILA|nr:hypothetical protein Y032_0374g212 [Ancylostoma ceylanicum]